MEKKLLVVSYVYPPDKGVGGRRWSKFAKPLTESGNKVFIITATPDENNKFTIQDDDGVTIHRIKSPYPNVLRFLGKMSFWNRIQYRLLKTWFLLTTKGNIYDTSIGWDKKLLPAITSLIKKEGIKNIFVTAPPYMHMYYVSKLKTAYPDINIILDFRDPWTELEAFDSIFHTASKRMVTERELEKKALALVDYIVSVSEDRTRLFEKFVADTRKLITITNGVDLNDYAFLAAEPSNINEYFSIVHSGSMNPGYTKYVKALVAFINKNKEALLKAKVKFEFCGHASSEMISILTQAPSEIIVYHGLLTQKDSLRILNRASAGLVLLKEGYENIHFITKLYEYMALKKKIVYISSSKAHSLSEFLSKKNIGITFSDEKLDELLQWLINKEQYNSLSYDNFDISPYEIVNLSKKVEALLK